MDDVGIDGLMQRVIGAAIEVHREFGAGFAELTYHRALAIELQHRGIAFSSEVPVRLRYREQVVGEGKIDLLIEDVLVVELKATQANPNRYKRQVVSYLKATNLRRGLVINFETDVLKDGLGRVSL